MARSSDDERRCLLQHAALQVWREVNRVLSAGGVPSLPVKGLVTARWLYEQPADREISDIDVRVRRVDLPRVRRLGLAEGWTLLRESRVYRQVTFCVAGVDVDIEASCGTPGLVALSIEDMLAGATVSSDSALAALGMIPRFEDHFLLLVVNAVKDHMIHANPWALEDLRRIVGTREMDANRVVEHAKRSDAFGMLLLVARHFAGEPGAHATWQVIAEAYPFADLRTRVFVNAYERVLRSGRPRWALRVGARVASDGWSRPLSSLARAAAWQLEGAALEFFPSITAHE